MRKNKILLPWLLETRLVSWKTAIEEAHIYTLDGTDTQFTLKWTGSDIVKENFRTPFPKNTYGRLLLSLELFLQKLSITHVWQGPKYASAIGPVPDMAPPEINRRLSQSNFWNSYFFSANLFIVKVKDSFAPVDFLDKEYETANRVDIKLNFPKSLISNIFYLSRGHFEKT